ncbi:MAG TPA: hypothetical protein VF297_12575 [Pyrinomonadaceae bacterium]
MAATQSFQRVELLLALALVHGEGEARDESGHEGEVEASRGLQTPARVSEALESLSVLSAPERTALGRRADWFARLTPEKQRAWLGHMLAHARSRALPVLEEHVHPSHVVEALRDEPRHVQHLIIGHLPPALALLVAESLGLSDAADSSPRRARQPVAAVVSVVRRAFMSNFVSARELESPTSLDLLSGVELARLVRLLGVCETALACRGVHAREALASFLRRFPAEDAQAIAAHIATLKDVDPARVSFAGEVVQVALGAEEEPAAMLDRTGLHLLALTLAGDDETRLRYTAQKLPLEIATWLCALARTVASDLNSNPRGGARQAREMMRLVARDTEALADGVKRRTLLAGAQQQQQFDGGGHPAGPPPE